MWNFNDLPNHLKEQYIKKTLKDIETPALSTKKPRKANLSPTERQEQVRLCHWLDLNKLDYFAVPNGSYKSKASAGLFKAEGLKSGVPDVVVFLRDQILFIEMKRIRGGTVSDNQKFWIEKINSYNYAIASVCYGADMAIDFIEHYLTTEQK